MGLSRSQPQVGGELFESLLDSESPELTGRQPQVAEPLANWVVAAGLNLKSETVVVSRITWQVLLVEPAVSKSSRSRLVWPLFEQVHLVGPQAVLKLSRSGSVWHLFWQNL